MTNSAGNGQALRAGSEYGPDLETRSFRRLEVSLQNPADDLLAVVVVVDVIAIEADAA